MDQFESKWHIVLKKCKSNLTSVFALKQYDSACFDTFKTFNNLMLTLL